MLTESSGFADVSSSPVNIGLMFNGLRTPGGEQLNTIAAVSVSFSHPCLRFLQQPAQLLVALKAVFLTSAHEPFLELPQSDPITQVPLN